ncbi:MAG: putative toxin-antitoxin system toxin component, PIN family [Chroococcidiopsidaceae cyanobacterium CP_BM_RX_35]|nr:putative toxin-antitoxin system toxin component, PIN family [Chroococcidiopsidaceae cyanobacterium CP_BM_RX_35]
MGSRIVIDTSVFVSALIGPTGPARLLLRQCFEGKYQPLFSNTLFCEYESVTTRKDIITRCPLSKEEIFTLLSAFTSISQWITIYYLWRPNLQDEADNHLIELAIAGNARLIATNNIKDFKNTQLLFPQLSILTPEQIIK